MAPHKIYIQPNARDGWFEGNKPNDNFVEYLRKDALLEWAKEREADTRDKAGTDDLACAYHDAIMDLIEKIELL